MEAAINLDGFKQSLNMHQLQFKNIIGDRNQQCIKKKIGTLDHTDQVILYSYIKLNVVITYNTSITKYPQIKSGKLQKLVLISISRNFF
jgi:hypothetical protein